MPDLASPPAPTPAPHALNTPDLPTLNEALGALYDDLNLLRTAADHIAESATAARIATDAAGTAVASASGVAAPTQALLDRVDRIDFPSRLDKLDATTAALFTGLQAAQARVETLDRSLRDVHADLTSRAEKAAQTMTEQSERLGLQTTLLWAILALGVVSALLALVR